MFEALNMEFMQNALMAGVLASMVCGLVGSLVVVNRLVFLSGGVAHASYGGVGLAFMLGLPVLPVTAFFAVLSALIMAWVTMRVRERADTVIGVMWASGMALGIILLDLTPGYNVDLMSYLFGSIMAVPTRDIWFMACLGVAVIAVVLGCYRGFLAMSLDEDFARSRGVPVTFLYFLLVAMIALCVVMIIRVVGLILVIALLTIPPFIAERRSLSLGRMMVISCLLSMVFSIMGLLFSYLLDVSSGATIIAVAACAFFLSFLFPDRRTMG